MRDDSKIKIGTWWLCGFALLFLLMLIQAKWDDAPFILDLLVNILSFAIGISIALWAIIGIIHMLIFPIKEIQEKGIKKFISEVADWFVGFAVPAILLLLFIYAIAKSIVL